MPTAGKVGIAYQDKDKYFGRLLWGLGVVVQDCVIL